MTFINSYTYYSYKKSLKNNSLSNFVSNIAVLIAKIHLCIIYFTSAIFKLNSKVWFTGVANYYILNLERFKGSSLNSYLSNNYIFVTLTTYSTLFWELSFPFLIWVKETKIYIVVIGILIHISILYFMMIHDFEILYIISYILFFNDKELSQFKGWILKKSCYARRLYN